MFRRTNYTRVSQKILETYESNLFCFSPITQYHWASRMWRISGDEKYLPAMFTDFQMRVLRISYLLNEIDKNGVENTGKIKLREYDTRGERKTKRMEYYKRRPEVLVYLDLVHYLFLAKLYKFMEAEELGAHFNKVKELVASSEVTECFISPDFIAVNPSAAVNSVFYLQYLGIADKGAEINRIYKSMWLNAETNSLSKWKDKIYAMTHLLIAASYFYGRYLDKEDYSWVLDYFNSNMTEIIENTTPDIVAEAGLCFKLCKCESGALEKAKRYVASVFDEQTGVITRKDGDLEKGEHRNIISFLLLRDFEKLYEGPDMKTFLKENKRVIYLPQNSLVYGSIASLD